MSLSPPACPLCIGAQDSGSFKAFFRPDRCRDRLAPPALCSLQGPYISERRLLSLPLHQRGQMTHTWKRGSKDEGTGQTAWLQSWLFIFKCFFTQPYGN